MEPVYIFSLPRSGSTLLQRSLAGRSEIATVSEPWFLLPLIYSLKKEGVYAEYSHRTLYSAIEDFYQQLPGGKRDYMESIAVFAKELYEKAGGSEKMYFLDKTPRYHLICQEIIDLFPGGKFIFLWRNPLACLASRLHSYDGNWRVHRARVDLYTGLVNLVNTAKNNEEQVLQVRYEDFVAFPEQEMRRILDYLSLSDDVEDGIHFNNSSLKGRMGDQRGVSKYTEVSVNSVEEWKKTLASPVRKSWAKRYLEWIGEERLAYIGHDKAALVSELKELDSNHKQMASDITRIAFGALDSLLDIEIVLEKIKARRKGGIYLPLR
ncbi:MAG: sulfotransferase [Gammaproteobacteria bacterium]|nr:sulfotransferase [Gammaproteobacteria bacterium]